MVEKKGLKLSGLSLGTVQLGVPYGIANTNGKPDETESARLLRTAVDGGILGFDTAGAYGDSEEVLGRYFEGKAKPTFISKMALEFGADTKGNDIERQMRSAVEATLSRLRIPSIPVMMLHHADVLLAHGEAVGRSYRQLIGEGLIERAGVSFGNGSEPDFSAYWEYVRDDLYEAVQIPFSILDQRLLQNGGIRLLKQAGKIVFARSIFLQGLLFLSPDALPDYLQEAEKPLRSLHRLAENEGQPLAQLAVSYVRDMEGIDSLVIGAETAEQLQSNLRLMAGPRLSERTRLDIREAVGTLPESVLNPFLWRDRFN